MPYDCRILEQTAQPALTIRTRTRVQDLPQAMGQAFAAIARYLEELSQCPAGPPFAAYHNMDMQDLDVEIGFAVSKKLPGRGDIIAVELPAGRVATCLHIGPYGEVGPAYEALSGFIAEDGYEATGVAYEMYLNDPAETPEGELKTQIVFPLKAG